MIIVALREIKWVDSIIGLENKLRSIPNRNLVFDCNFLPNWICFRSWDEHPNRTGECPGNPFSGKEFLLALETDATIFVNEQIGFDGGVRL
jgi:hypothetical protein